MAPRATNQPQRSLNEESMARTFASGLRPGTIESLLSGVSLIVYLQSVYKLNACYGNELRRFQQCRIEINAGCSQCLTENQNARVAG
jgi:uncharacterized membrane protein YcfT